MKKLMSLLLIACVSVFVIGCGEGDKKDAKKDGAKPAKSNEAPKDGGEKKP